MLNRKSMKQLFATACILTFFLSCKCFTHDSIKGVAYTGNPYTHDNPDSILIGEVDIEFNLEESNQLTFFQISIMDPDTNSQFILVENSPALLQALYQSLDDDGGVESITGEFPAINLPQPDTQSGNGKLDFTRILTLPMGFMGGAAGCKKEGHLKSRYYYSLDNSFKLLGVLSAKKGGWDKGPIKNLIAFSFGDKKLFVVIKTSYFYDFFKEEEKKWREQQRKDDQGRGGAGSSAGLFAYYHSVLNTVSPKSLFAAKRLLWIPDYPDNHLQKTGVDFLLMDIFRLF